MPTSDRDPMTPLPTWSLLMGGPTPSALPNQPPLASPSAGWWVGGWSCLQHQGSLTGTAGQRGAPLASCSVTMHTTCSRKENPPRV